jgi:hypothetical protein
MEEEKTKQWSEMTEDERSSLEPLDSIHPDLRKKMGIPEEVVPNFEAEEKAAPKKKTKKEEDE